MSPITASGVPAPSARVPGPGPTGGRRVLAVPPRSHPRWGRCPARRRYCAASRRNPHAESRCRDCAAPRSLRPTRTAPAVGPNRVDAAVENPVRPSAGRTCSTGRTAGSRRNRKCGYQSPCVVRSEYCLSVRSSDRKCSGAHPVGRVRLLRRSGRRPGRPCSYRSDH